MDMELSEDKKMKVRFKDYGFFVPKNAAGHRATIKGIASIDTITVAEQIEWARDAEKPEGEIAEIKEPKISYTFLAEGVIIQ
jgi:hypothetical protein